MDTKSLLIIWFVLMILFSGILAVVIKIGATEIVKARSELIECSKDL